MKRALCVGINRYPQPGMDLQGCVNDAGNWSTLLVDHYDFARDDVTVLLDEQATHANILAGLKALMAGATKGDVLVFTNSSHGTYLADTTGDEPVYDEAMCPYDTADHPLVDDELRTLFADLAAGVSLAVLADSCHSGSVTRAMPLRTPDQRRVRFMSPRAIGRPEIPEVRRTAQPRKEAHPEADMKEILLSGCKSSQYSYDAVIGDAPSGAFSHFALVAIRDASYKITYEELHALVVPALAESNYDQEPQLEGTAADKARQIFV
ncbi:MAG: caspase family protein [Acidimicrobiales bacterium]